MIPSNHESFSNNRLICSVIIYILHIIVSNDWNPHVVLRYQLLNILLKIQRIIVSNTMSKYNASAVTYFLHAIAITSFIQY